MSPPLRVVVIGAGGRLGGAACSAIEAQTDLALVGQFSSRDDWRARLAEVRPDVALDATRAGLGAAHGLACLEAGARIVVATSGVTLEQEAALDQRARELSLGGLIVPNFSLGAMLLLRACAEFARHFPACEIIEMHHDKKRDAPSATALETERRIRSVPSRPPAPVPIHSVRLPGLYAHQEVLFAGPGEVLSLRHDAFSPQAFQAGIVAAVRHAARASGVQRGIEHAFDA
ncbi:MAG TPA: dihydrodipicolinate reductase C-terminal domain-containing protein [Planctomycetota bacterium]|nr:dihydrodipicolinate reductase C-terminal domain-containing protein [Planctomycetota bacterium]